MRFWIAALSMALVAATRAMAQGGGSGQAQSGARNVANAKYVGVRACRACHRTEAQGSMFTIWERSKHAHAYDTLASARAREVGARLGVTNPQTDGKCLICHVTAYGVPAARKQPRFDQSEGVGCEACHGAGELYKTKRTMCQITAGQVDPASVGLVIPDEQTCVRCHNDKSPTWPGSFNYEQMQRQIAHPIPAARKQKDKTEGCGAAGAGAGEPEGE